MAEVQRVLVVEQEAAGYVKICAVLALILAIAAYVIPVIGVLFITPFAIVFGCIALYGGDFKYLGAVTIFLIAVNLLISPTFWLNIGAGVTIVDASGNRFLTYFDIGGVIAMLGLWLYGKKEDRVIAPTHTFTAGDETKTKARGQLTHGPGRVSVAAAYSRCVPNSCSSIMNRLMKERYKLRAPMIALRVATSAASSS
jgi:hypothetical protein